MLHNVTFKISTKAELVETERRVVVTRHWKVQNGEMLGKGNTLFILSSGDVVHNKMNKMNN